MQHRHHHFNTIELSENLHLNKQKWHFDAIQVNNQIVYFYYCALLQFTIRNYYGTFNGRGYHIVRPRTRYYSRCVL